MQRLIIKQKVKDFKSWKTYFDDFKDTRKSFGERSFQIMHPTDDPNNLVMIFEWDTAQNAQNFFHSAELRERMKKAGVMGEPQVEYVTEVASGKL